VAIRHKAGTIAGTMAVLSIALTGIANGQTASFNQKAAGYVETFIHKAPYRYGGSSPSAGFDCSGLTQYVYKHLGKSIPRTAEAQYEHFKRISRSQAWGGDLVFFHETSSPGSPVYHVGIYEGSNHMVSAANSSEGIVWQTIWSSDVTFGTITH
jgi:cell wall-associated NlpC family hydrolase